MLRLLFSVYCAVQERRTFSSDIFPDMWTWCYCPQSFICPVKASTSPALILTQVSSTEMMKYTYVHSRMSTWTRVPRTISSRSQGASLIRMDLFSIITLCYMCNGSLCDPFMMLSVASVLFFNWVLLIVFKQLHENWCHVVTSRFFTVEFIHCI